MAVLDDDFSIGATLTEGSAGVWSSPKSTAAASPQDFRALYERNSAARHAMYPPCGRNWRASKHFFPKPAPGRTRAHWSRRSARRSPGCKLPWRHRQRAGAVPGGEARRARTALEVAPQPTETIKTLRKEITRLSREVGRGNKAIGDFHKKLDKEKERAESIRETAKMLSRENLSLHRENRILGEQAAKVRAMTDENYWLRLALEGSQFTNKKLTARIAKLRATGATLTKLPFDEAAHLRNVLRRSRRQKATIKSLSRENARLREAVKASRRCSRRCTRRSSPTRTTRRCAMPTRPNGACRNFAAKSGRAAPGCGRLSAPTRSASISTHRAAPRRGSSCSPKPGPTLSSLATATAPTSGSSAFSRTR